MSLTQSEVKRIEADIFSLAATVEAGLENALRLLEAPDTVNRNGTVSDKQVFSNLAAWVEERSLNLLALHQPLAADFRKIVTLLKICTALEQSGAHTVEISTICTGLSQNGNGVAFRHAAFIPHARRVAQVLHQAFACFTHAAPEKACTVLQQVQHLKRERSALIDDLNETVRKNTTQPIVSVALEYLDMLRSFHWIVEHSANIARYAVFMIAGTHFRPDSSARQTMGRNYE